MIRDLVIVFMILLVLLIIISAIGGSIRHIPPSMPRSHFGGLPSLSPRPQHADERRNGETFVEYNKGPLPADASVTELPAPEKDRSSSPTDRQIEELMKRQKKIEGFLPSRGRVFDHSGENVESNMWASVSGDDGDARQRQAMYVTPAAWENDGRDDGLSGGVDVNNVPQPAGKDDEFSTLAPVE